MTNPAHNLVSNLRLKVSRNYKRNFVGTTTNKQGRPYTISPNATLHLFV